MPFYVNIYRRRNQNTRLNWPIMIMGFRPEDCVFRISGIEHYRRLLKKQETVLLDRLHLAHCGDFQIGEQVELEKQRFKVVGDYRLGAGYIVEGTAVVSDQNYQRVAAPKTMDDLNLGLLQLEKGANPELIAQQLRQNLPPDVRVLTRAQLGQLERKYWSESTSSGIIFGSGAALAFIVGIIILYQVFSSEINDHLAEYATLKAIGYSNYQISFIVLQQSLLLVCISYFISILLALAAYDEIRNATQTKIAMTEVRLVLVFTIAVAMSLVASVFSIRKVLLVDPADVF